MWISGEGGGGGSCGGVVTGADPGFLERGCLPLTSVMSRVNGEKKK